MGMSAEEFKKLLEPIQNNTAFELNLFAASNYKLRELNEKQLIQLIQCLKDNVSIVRFATSRIDFSPKAAQVLADILRVNRTLQHLSITSCEAEGIGDEGAAALASVLNETSLVTLSFIYGGIGDKGAIALAAALQENNSLVKFRFMQNILVGVAGIRALALAVQKNRCLRSLDLSSNGLDIDCVKALVPVFQQRDGHLQDLDIAFNNIGDDGIMVIAPILRNSLVRVLNLSNNSSISIKGVQTIASSLKEGHLRELDLSDSEIGDEGAQALAIGIKGSRLQGLRLVANKISDKGAQVLIAATKGKESALQHLSLEYNEICAEDEALVLAVKESSLVTLDLSRNYKLKDHGVKSLTTVLVNSSLDLRISSDQLDVDGLKNLERNYVMFSLPAEIPSTVFNIIFSYTGSGSANFKDGFDDPDTKAEPEKVVVKLS